MLPIMQNRRIFIANEPVDFRLGLQGLSDIVINEKKQSIHDGALYVLFNRAYDKIKILTWDLNGFVLYYKRLDKIKFKVDKLQKGITTLTYPELENLLAGLRPEDKFAIQ